MKRLVVFYGWYIVAAGLILSAYNAGAFVYGFTALINPLAAAFGWSYAQISLAISFRGLEVGALDPFLGAAVDRWPARRLMLIGVSICGLGVICVSQAANLAMFYAGFLIIGLGSSLSLFMIPHATIARWFKRDLGKANGILVMGRGIGGLLLPLLVIFIDTCGWQNALITLAVGLWILGIPLSFVFRNRPEEYGLLPDGKPQDSSMVKGNSDIQDLGVGVREAFKMRAFWHMSVAELLQAGAMMAAITHVMPYLTSLGVERSMASMVTMTIPLASLGTRLPFGMLADIFTKKYVAAISYILTSIGLFLFWLIDGSSFGLMIAFAIVFGLGVGGVAPMRPILVREYFGIKKFGTIFGLIGVFSTIGLALCPPIAGWVFDTLGYYDPIWLVFSATSLAGAIVMSTAPMPHRKPEKVNEQ